MGSGFFGLEFALRIRSLRPPLLQLFCLALVVLSPSAMVALLSHHLLSVLCIASCLSQESNLFLSPTGPCKYIVCTSGPGRLTCIYVVAAVLVYSYMAPTTFLTLLWDLGYEFRVLGFRDWCLVLRVYG